MKTDSEIIEPAEKPTIPERIAEVVVVPLLLGIIAIGFAAVCLRFLFGGRYALFWSEEVIRYSFIWMFWICAPVLVWRGALFSVDLVVNALPQRVRAAVTFVTNLGILLLMGTYVYYGWIMAEINGRQLSSALSIPLKWIYLAIPVGSTFIVVAILVQTIKLLPVIIGKGKRP